MDLTTDIHLPVAGGTGGVIFYGPTVKRMEISLGKVGSSEFRRGLIEGFVRHRHGGKLSGASLDHSS